MSLNPQANEWKPSFTAKEFVPPFDAPAQPPPVPDAPPAATTQPSAPAPGTLSWNTLLKQVEAAHLDLL